MAKAQLQRRIRLFYPIIAYFTVVVSQDFDPRSITNHPVYWCDAFAGMEGSTWDRFVTEAPRQRTPSCNNIVIVSQRPDRHRFKGGTGGRSAEQGISDQPQDCRQVAQARDCRRHEEWANRIAVYGADESRESGDHCFRRYTLLSLDACLYACNRLSCT